MNSKNLDALFDGLTGNVPTPRPLQPSTEITVPDKIRHRSGKHDRPQEERFCTIVNSDILHKIRLIATREGLQIKDVVNAAFVRAIMSYEEKHGEIVERNRDASNLF